ncbi:glutathione S-transferase family protein [Chondromyces apiculatus]|uniref:Glutathione S-transferase n=1 Tax=Chondromyces apiculatus DSM 436 TaxID=1192034 RepID=A0A017T5C9_9BACT|nr:glutathione S-transferase family protein [Chondromyces apiculatus]EYF04439.1 Glutathione S-transferase [Chondromyces apiculatus DSM 436]
MIRVSAFRWVPPFAQGLVRELRVRWALEEAGIPYEDLLIGPEHQRTPEYREMQPFGQVPAYDEDGLVMFESGAIVLHIAERSEVLMPTDPVGRARTQTWMFAALSSIEPHIQNLSMIDIFHTNEEWAKLRRPGAVAMVQQRLQELATCLGDREYLEGRFTAGDLLMSTVLRILRSTDILEQFPTLAAYRTRCEARPAFERALAAQLAPFAANAPPAANAAPPA